MKDLSTFVDKEKINKVEGEKIYNSLKDSESSQFYEELFSDSFETIPKPELYSELKNKHGNDVSYNKSINEVVAFLEKELPGDSIVIEIGGGVSQKRSADAYQRFKYYYPLDISKSSIAQYSEKFDKVGFIADAEELPFNDNSIDCIFTHTFLEHPMNPEKVLKEIIRVLKPGGIIVHIDAWFCRWWQRFGIVGLRKFGTLNFKERMIWLGAKITEIPILRIPPIILRRLYKELFRKNERNISLAYKKLKPNYTLHLGCDEDAASSIDPIDVVRFYESMGFSLIHKLSFKERLLFPNKYIMLRKQR